MSREYPDAPRVGIGAVVLKGDDVLLIRRGKPPRVGQLSLPGGGQELGETVYQGAMREVLEETGVSVDVLGLVDVVDAITRDAQGRVQFHYTLVDVVCNWRAGNPVAGGDAADALWVPLADIEAIDLWKETKRIIQLSADMRDALEDAAL